MNEYNLNNHIRHFAHLCPPSEDPCSPVSPIRAFLHLCVPISLLHICANCICVSMRVSWISVSSVLAHSCPAHCHLHCCHLPPTLLLLAQYSTPVPPFSHLLLHKQAKCERIANINSGQELGGAALMTSWRSKQLFHSTAWHSQGDGLSGFVCCFPGLAAKISEGFLKQADQQCCVDSI